jgi:hypothetical protein
MMLSTRKKEVRGQVLLMTAFFIFVLFALALAFFKLVPYELNSALRTKQMVNAQVIADSGIREARVWLQRQDPARVLNDAVLEDEFNRTTRDNPIAMGNTWDEGASAEDVIGDWTYTVTLVRNPTNPFAFDAVSTCFFDEEPMRQVRATLARQNFSRYALFIDRWGDELVMKASPGAIQGPFHTNDFFRLFIPDGFYGSSTDSFVSGVDGVMTHAGSTAEGGLDYVGETGDGNAYHGTGAGGDPNSDENAVPYGEDGEVSGRYESIVRGGRSNLSSTEHVVLPYDSNELMIQSLGAEDAGGATIPSEVGIYVPTDNGLVPRNGDTVAGGIYLVGRASIELDVVDGNQVHTFTQTIPEDAYAYQTEETYSEPIYGNVPVTLSVGDSYNVSSPVTQDVTRQVQVGTETRTETITEQVPTGRRLVTGGGGTTVGQYETTYRTVTRTVTREVPVYDSVTEQQTVTSTRSVTISDPNDPMIGQTVNSYQVVGHEDRTRTVSHIVTEEDYEANPAAYPDAYPIELPGTPKVAKVTEVDGPNPRTIFEDYEGVVHELQGALNGVTFVDGDITSLQGTSKGARDMNFPDEEVYQGRYIVSNPSFTGELTISDDLLQYYDGDNPDLVGAQPNTLKVGELSPGSQHSLGLVAKDVRMKPANNNILNMYAVIIAGRSVRGTGGENTPPDVVGGFGSDESIMRPGYSNEFNLFGGLVQANQRLWQRDGNGMSGNLTYDPAVAGNLPRFPRSNLVTTLRYADRFVPNEDAI